MRITEPNIQRSYKTNWIQGKWEKLLPRIASRVKMNCALFDWGIVHADERQQIGRLEEWESFNILTVWKMPKIRFNIWNMEYHIANLFTSIVVESSALTSYTKLRERSIVLVHYQINVLLFSICRLHFNNSMKICSTVQWTVIPLSTLVLELCLCMWDCVWMCSLHLCFVHVWAGSLLTINLIIFFYLLHESSDAATSVTDVAFDVERKKNGKTCLITTFEVENRGETSQPQ